MDIRPYATKLALAASVAGCTTAPPEENTGQSEPTYSVSSSQGRLNQDGSYKFNGMEPAKFTLEGEVYTTPLKTVGLTTGTHDFYFGHNREQAGMAVYKNGTVVQALRANGTGTITQALTGAREVPLNRNVLEWKHDDSQALANISDYLMQEGEQGSRCFLYNGAYLIQAREDIADVLEIAEQILFVNATGGSIFRTTYDLAKSVLPELNPDETYISADDPKNITVPILMSESTSRRLNGDERTDFLLENCIDRTDLMAVPEPVDYGELINCAQPNTESMQSGQMGDWTLYDSLGFRQDGSALMVGVGSAQSFSMEGPRISLREGDITLTAIIERQGQVSMGINIVDATEPDIQGASIVNAGAACYQDSQNMDSVLCSMILSDEVVSTQSVGNFPESRKTSFAVTLGQRGATFYIDNQQVGSNNTPVHSANAKPGFVFTADPGYNGSFRLEQICLWRK